MRAACKLLAALLLALPAVYALGPQGAEANTIDYFLTTTWDTWTEAAGNPFWYGIGAALALFLFAALARLPPEGFAIVAVLAVIIVSTVIPLVALVAVLIFGTIIGIALLKIFGAR